MEDEPDPPIRPPFPPNDYNDIPNNIDDFIGGESLDSAEILLNSKALGDSFVRHYYGCVRSIDVSVGRLMEYVYNSDKKWFVMLTSDHGYHLLDKGRMTKFTLWRAATQVPLLLYGGPATGGNTISTPVSLIDTFPTFVDLLGEDSVDLLTGMSLLNTAAIESRDPAVIYWNESKAVVKTPWYLIVYPGEIYELYHDDDPWQLENLAD